MDKKILFLGAINNGNKPSGGVEYRNQILLKKFEKKYSKEFQYIDVSKHRNNKLFLGLLLLLKLLFYQRIIISIADGGLERLAYLNFLLSKKDVTIFVAGGDIHNKMDKESVKKLLENATLVYTQTKSFKKKILQKSDEVNAMYLPNFKTVPQISYSPNKIESDINLLYLSRIHRDKGIFRCFQVVKRVNEIDAHRNYCLDIYGNIDLSANDRSFFFDKVNSCDNINFQGFLDLTSKDNYQVLSKYHFLLFLTDHFGEGFPGVLIDAMIARIPVIASDWKYNSEILHDGEGILGDIISLDEGFVNKVTKAVMSLASNEDKYSEIQQRMKNEVQNYDIENLDINIC